MKIRCQVCDGIGHIDETTDGAIKENIPIEDGSIIWGVCDECGASITISCIVRSSLPNSFDFGRF